MKRILLACLIIFNLVPLYGDTTKETRLLIELHIPATEFENKLTRNFPTVEILATFDTLINGIAIEGNTRHLERIKQDEAIKQAYPISTYQVTPDQFQLIDKTDLPKDRPATTYPYTGKNVKVGVIDTGIDYTHPDLEANYHGGFDVVDFDDDPMETTAKQGIPTLHGTHVAGIIGANGTIQGIAPDVETYGYRALSQ